MRKLFLSLSSVSLLLVPSLALAAFETPTALITSLQEQSGRSFQMTVHSKTQETYVSVWASGTSEGSLNTMEKLQTKGTVDIVQGDLKIRAKGEMLATNGTLYVKLNSLTGNYQSALGVFNISGHQNTWLSMPMSSEITPFLTTNIALDIDSIDAENADTMYTLQHTTSNGNNVYTLQLTPDSAAGLAIKIRAMLGDTNPVSDDFYPWRALAEGIHYELVIKTDTNDRFLSSTLNLSTATITAHYKATITEASLAKALTITAPKDAMNLEDILGIFSPMMSEDMSSPLEAEEFQEVDLYPEEAMFPFNEEDFSDEDYDVDPACTASDLTALVLLSLQRTGACPTDKISTRFRR